MIVAAAKRRPKTPDDAKRSPVQADLRQRRPHQRADENQIAAVFRAKQLHGPAELTDRNPVMAEARHLDRIASPLSAKNNRIDAARDKRIRDRERHHPARRRSGRPAKRYPKPRAVMAARVSVDRDCCPPSSSGRHSARCLPSPMKARISAIAGIFGRQGCTSSSRSAKMPGPETAFDRMTGRWRVARG